MHYIFLADIGGTNARFELLKMNQKNELLTISKKSNLITSSYNSFDQAFQDFLDGQE